jgi:hypothetical protein
MNESPRWWKVALMDFVDDFRRNPNLLAIAEPFVSGDDQKDALLASVIETLCDEARLSIPEWVQQVPACRKPFFVSGLENLKALALAESPIHFRIRKVFVLENFLQRV